MRRKWTIQSIKDLIARKNRYTGKNLAGFFKKEKMSEQNYYNLKKKLECANRNPEKAQVLEIIPQKAGYSKAELIFPDGHMLRISGNDIS